MASETSAGTCFVVAPIGPDGSEIRQRSNDLLDFVIRPVATAAGYSVIRADELNRPGLIDSHIIELIFDAELVIADLTGLNPNVMYELGIRHAVAKPTIHMVSGSTELPFDIKHQRTVFLDHTNIRSVEEGKRALARQMAVLQADPTDFDNPVTRSVNVSALRASNQPIEQQLASLTEVVNGLSMDLLETLHDPHVTWRRSYRRSVVAASIVGDPDVFEQMVRNVDHNDQMLQLLAVTDRLSDAELTTADVAAMDNFFRQFEPSEHDSEAFRILYDAALSDFNVAIRAAVADDEQE